MAVDRRQRRPDWRGDRWSDDDLDRIEWQLDRLRVWARVGVIGFFVYAVWDVLRAVI